MTRDGIAEAFIEFAKREGLSFFERGSFDAVKYRRLSEELECTEIFLSEVIAAEETFRIDAEFFKKSYVAMFDKLNSMHQKKLRDCAEKIDVGFVGNMVSEYTADISAPILLQTKNIFEFEVNLNDVVHINQKFHQHLKKSQLHHENVLLARSGSFGKASIWLKDYVANSADIIIVKTCRERLSPYYLVALLNSYYGREQLFRFSSGGVQGHVNLTILENLIVPEMSMNFQDDLKKILCKAHDLSERADENYHAAEKILSAALGLDNFTPSPQNIAIKNFSASFTASGRLDAEFYQPKYDDLKIFLDTLTTYELGDIVKIFKSIEPGSDCYGTDGTPFTK